MFRKIVGLGFSTKGKNAKDIESYIKTLVEGGASEFFTGYNPPYWYEQFGFEVSPNGRFAEHEQISDAESLALIVKEVHKYGLEIFVNLNAWYYTEVTFPLVERMVAEFIEMEVDGIICGNIGILEYLKSINYTGKINISTIMAVYNTEAIRYFLENYSINKVILSREVTLKEIEKLVNAFPQTFFEVFGEGDFCRYNNGLCFAEHKYGTRDICTVVVNDLIITKKFRADYKKIILNPDLSTLEKIECFDDRYEELFEQIEHLLELLVWEAIPLSPALSPQDGKEELDLLLNLIEHSKNRVDLFYDAISGPQAKHNKRVMTYYRALQLLESQQALPKSLQALKKELGDNIKSGMHAFFLKLKEIGGAPKLKALETGLFYSKADLLNLYTYLYFSTFPNIQTVKFPNRGRNYAKKLKLIESVVESGKVGEDMIDRTSSIERSHYDLTYLFGGNRLWFREMLKKYTL